MKRLLSNLRRLLSDFLKRIFAGFKFLSSNAPTFSACASTLSALASTLSLITAVIALNYLRSDHHEQLVEKELAKKAEHFLVIAGTVASPKEIEINVPKDFYVCEGMLFIPSVTPIESAEFRLFYPSTTLDLTVALSSYEDELRTIFLQIHKEFPNLRTHGRVSLRIPACARIRFNTKGETPLQHDLYEIFCNVSWDFSQEDGGISLSMNGFGYTRSIYPEQMKNKKLDNQKGKLSDYRDLLNKLWENRKAKLISTISP